MTEFEAALASGELHPNEAKMALAREIVTIFHGEDGAASAQKRWDETFRNKDGDGIPDDIPEKVLPEAKRLVDILRDNDMVSSGSEAKRLASNNGIRVNGEQIDDVNMDITPDLLPIVVQVGKRKFLRLKGK
jgi:tyrosyl-tRNA synthetase